MHSRSKQLNGKAKSGGAGKADLITKTREMESKAIQDCIVRLRNAVYDEDGKDRDLTEKMGHFKTFKKNGLDLEISFETKLSKAESQWCHEMVKDNMEETYDSSGYGWDDEDKVRIYVMLLLCMPSFVFSVTLTPPLFSLHTDERAH